MGSGPNARVTDDRRGARVSSEDEGGEPFIGRSGRLLFRLIEEELGLERVQCFVTNVVKCRPPEQSHAASRRDRDVSALARRSAGRTCDLALSWPSVIRRRKSIFGYDEGIGQTHGVVTQLGTGPGMATYHPAAALRSGASVLQRHARRPARSCNDFGAHRELAASLRERPGHPTGRARNWLRTLRSGDIVLLSGQLGAGKTTFVKGVARGLGVLERVTSPTFTMVRPHQCHNDQGITTLLHADVYRVESLEKCWIWPLGNWWKSPRSP